MKIVLTGASGGVGREFVRQFPDTCPVSVRYGDYSALASKLRTADALVCAGALLHAETEHAFRQANVRLPLDILKLVSEVRGSSLPVLLISSMSILKNKVDYLAISDMSPYARSKYRMELEARKSYEGVVNYTNIRFSTIFYGDPLRDGRSKLIYTAKSKKEVDAVPCHRDFIPIDSGVALLEDFICSKVAGRFQECRSINIATGQRVNLMDIARYLEEKYGIVVNEKESPGVTVCSEFDAPWKLGLRKKFLFDILKETGDYYDRIDFCDGR